MRELDALAMVVGGPIRARAAARAELQPPEDRLTGVAAWPLRRAIAAARARARAAGHGFFACIGGMVVFLR